MLLNTQGTGILFHPFSRKNLRIDDHAVHTRRNSERGVFDFACLLAENGPEQLLLWGKLGLTLWRYLSHQDITGLDTGEFLQALDNPCFTGRPSRTGCNTHK